MNVPSLHLREYHAARGARFATVKDYVIVAHFGDVPGEHSALRIACGLLDLSFRGRLCVIGSDRVRYLHGQITNDVKKLAPGHGCYAALVTAKGRMESDLTVFALADELLLDFEPGLSRAVTARLEKFIVADDVQVVDAAMHYGLLSLQGPLAGKTLVASGLCSDLPKLPLSVQKISSSTLGDIYIANHPRLLRTADSGFDVFAPVESLALAADALTAAAKNSGGRWCGWDASEVVRVESGIPRFGADMDETSIPLECGIESRAISYNKGCYIGQEVINRIHSIGHVNRELCGLQFAASVSALPLRHQKIFKDGKECGLITSALRSPVLGTIIALGYVRREANQIGVTVMVKTDEGELPATPCAIPFVK